MDGKLCKLSNGNIMVKNLLWSKKEEKILKTYYPQEGRKVAKRLPNRTITAIDSKICRLGLKRNISTKFQRKSPNRYREKDNKVYIQLTKNKEAIIDKEDYDLIKNYHWHAVKSGNVYYASTRDSKNNNCNLRMHQLIMNHKNIDHINGDGLNNCRENLRIASQQENSFNQRPRKDSKTGFKGVHKTQNNTWIARIRLNGRTYYSKRFKTPEEAAKAYDELATKYFGEYAKLNFKGDNHEN